MNLPPTATQNFARRVYAAFFARPAARVYAGSAFYILHFTFYIFLSSCSPAPENPQIPKSPNPQIRIVSLAPNLTESLAVINALPFLVGRTFHCDYPAEALAEIPSTGLFGEPDLERVIALRPTHVVYTDLRDKTIHDTLCRFGINVVQIPCERLDEIAPAIRVLGELTGRAADAGAFATHLETRLAELRAASEKIPDAERPDAFFFLGDSPLYTVGRDSFITDLLYLAGGRNIAADTATAYFPATPEIFISRNPGILIPIYDAPPGTLHKNLSQHPGWAATRAIRENRVIEGLPLDLLTRPGPRVLEAIEALREALERLKKDE